ncbi:MAG: hypothetical protein AAGF01_32475 [Cyanobacteria bacterium P01_G01_bin.38]
MKTQLWPYPLRSLICHKALAELQGHKLTSTLASPPWDHALFEELANTLLNPSIRTELRRRHVSRATAAAVENHLAAILVQTYLDIQKRRQDHLVQKLNALWSSS